MLGGGRDDTRRHSRHDHRTRCAGDVLDTRMRRVRVCRACVAHVCARVRRVSLSGVRRIVVACGVCDPSSTCVCVRARGRARRLTPKNDVGGAAVAYARVATTIFERVTTRTSGEAARGRVLGTIEKIRRRRRRTRGDDERLVEKIRETTRVIRSAAALNFLFSA